MAEGVLSSRLHGRGLQVTVESAGLAALVGHPADPMAQQAAAERGVDISAHRARQLTPELIRSFELILVMDADQQRAVESMSPSARGRVHRLGRWSNFDVPDPYRRDRAAFDRAYALIERGVDDLENAFWRRR